MNISDNAGTGLNLLSCMWATLRTLFAGKCLVCK
jgi:hypothetical protein